MRPGGPSSLRDGLEAAEAGRFVGRDEELAALAEICAAEEGRVAYVCGPAGVGKSALLAAAVSSQRSTGRTIATIGPPDAGSLAGLARLGAAERPLVVIEDLDRSGSAVAYVRETVLPALPPGATLLVESRRPPPALLAGRLGSAVRVIPLRPLRGRESLALLAAHGVRGPAAAEICGWARGFPAALVLAVATGTGAPGDAEIIARIGGEETAALEPAALTAASLSRVVEPRLLEAAGVADPAAAMRSLAATSVCDLRAEGLELHPLLRQALRGQIREHSPDRGREIRRRLADHLHRQARRGESWQLVELAGLIEDPAVRWGFGGGEDPDLRADRPAAADLARIEQATTARHGPRWWDWTRRWLTERPEAAVVVRDGGGSLRGFCLATSLRRLPDWAREDPVIGGWVAHAREAAPLGEAVLWREALTLGGDDEERARALLNATATLRSGAVNPRWFYGPVDPANERERGLSLALGATHLGSLDVDLDGERIECHRIDHGPGGVIGLARDIVYRELGIAPRRPASPEEVREALRALRHPTDLSGSPLTSDGLAPAEQRREVRARLTAAADAAFGDEPEERLLRESLDLAYLRADADPASAPGHLNVSRATYYRRLNRATERLAEQVAADG